MRVLALDISTHAGFAVLDGEMGQKPRLECMGVVQNLETVLAQGPYPWCYVTAASKLSLQLWNLAFKYKPDVVVIEETNLGKNRYTQKLLEFIHFDTLMQLHTLLDTLKVVYISSSGWRSNLGLSMSKDDKKNNARLSKAKRAAADTGTKLDKKALGVRGRVKQKHLAIRYVNENFGLSLKVKDNDIADAICLGTAYFNNASLCDGV